MGRGPGVRAASDSSIQIDFIWQGKRYRERLRLAPTPRNLKYAQGLKATIEHEIATNAFDYARHFPRSKRAARFAGAGIEAALKAYCDSLVSSLEPETVDEYRKDCAALAKEFGPKKPLARLTALDVRAFVSSSKLSKKRLDNLLIPLRGAIRQAVEDGVMESNPIAGFKIRRTAKGHERIDPFSPAEVVALGKTVLGPLWSAWAWTGLRSGEIIGLEWQDVDLRAGTARVQRAVRVGREKAPKTRAGLRTLKLLPAALAALEALHRPQSSGAVFRNPNTDVGWYEDRALARAFRKACEESKVRYRYPYQLRHTFASTALSAGENPAWISNYMGHADKTMIFRVYGKWMPQLDPQAGQRMVAAAGKAA